MPSSTSSTSRRSPTATTTGSAISRAVEKLDYIAGLGVDLRSGSCRSIPRRCATTATTSPTTTASTPRTARMHDFRTFVRAAHERGLRVITELVINHTSDQHPWFQRARRAQRGSAARGLLRLERHRPEVSRARGSSSPTPRPRTGPGTRSRANITGIASFRHQPDLNFDNPRGASRRSST